MTDETREPLEPHDERRQAPRPYSPPVLTEYGSVARMTQGGTSHKGDKGGAGGFRADKG
jgi:hypothetical protein